MVVIFGTYALGKKDLVEERRTCPHCGKPNRRVQSRTAWQCVHIYWIPVFPAGRTRVVMQCLACKKSYMLNLKSKKLDRAIEATLGDARASLTDGSDVIDHLNSLTHLGVFQTVEGLLDELDGRNDQTLARLARASYCAIRGLSQQAQEHYEAAVSGDADGAAALAYGKFLLAAQRDEEAINMLRRAAQLNPQYEYRQVLADFIPVRQHYKNYNGLAVIMEEIVRIDPTAKDDKKFARLLHRALAKAGRTYSSNVWQ